jgi:DNA-binding HxlR family transcriptional regulator
MSMPRDTKAPAAGGASESMAKPNSCWLRASPAVQALAGRWTLAVLAELANGRRRYQALLDALDVVSHKVLTDTLRRAERDGLVARHLDARRVETATLYQLTDIGRSLDEPRAVLGRWSEANWLDVEASRRRWSRRSV